MKIVLHLYLEHGTEGPVWWTESPDVPGFHATGAQLQEAVLRSKIALSEILNADIDLDCSLIGYPPSSQGDPSDARVSGGIEDVPRSSGAPVRILLEA